MAAAGAKKVLRDEESGHDQLATSECDRRNRISRHHGQLPNLKTP